MRKPIRCRTPAQKRRRRAQALAHRYRRGLERKYGRHCAQCKDASNELTVDHIYPLSRGGCLCFHNLQLLCIPCNELKDDAIPEPLGRGHRSADHRTRKETRR